MKSIWTIISSLFFLLIIACDNKPGTSTDNQVAYNAKPQGLYHYSIWAALVNKVFDGNLTAKEAKTHGDIGLGTFNGADGELIMLDGILYQVPASGEVLQVNDSMHIPYLNATFYRTDFDFQVRDKINYDSLRKLIVQHFHSKNYFYAFKIHGDFDSLKLGSMHKQQKPYPEGLDSLLPKRPHFDHTHISGTM